MAVFTGNGSAVSPSFTFSSDTNTGIYRANENDIAISTGGTQQFRVTANRMLLGQEYIPSGSGIAGNANAQVTAGNGSLTLYRSDNTSTGVRLTLGKNRGTSPSNLSPVQSGDDLGIIHFIGSDGTVGGVESATLTAQCLQAAAPGVVRSRLRLRVSDATGSLFNTLQTKIDVGGVEIVSLASPFDCDSYVGTAGSTGPNWIQNSARGTLDAPTKTLQDDRFLGIVARGYNGTSFTTGTSDTFSASIEFRAEEDQDLGNGSRIIFRTAPIGLNSDRVTRVTIKGDGNVGIGTSSPTSQLQLSTDSAAKPSTNTWTIVSDERIKEDIEPANLDTCLEIVKNLPLKRFKWKDEVYPTDMVDDRHKIGWIAQDVESVFPKAVHTKEFRYGQVYDTVPGIPAEVDEEGNVISEGTEGETVLVSEQVIPDCKDLNSDQIYAAMFGAVQKLIEKVETLEAELQNLKD